MPEQPQIVREVNAFTEYGSYEGVVYGHADKRYTLYFWSDGIVTWTATR